MIEVNLGGIKVGAGHPPLVVAELSANHNGSLQQAFSIIEAAAKAGAKAIKLQTYTADSMTLNSELPDFRIKDGPWSGYKLYDLYSEACTPYEWHAPLYAKAKALGMLVFSTPFDEAAVDFLETLDTAVYKVASFELTDLALIKKIALTGRPIIMSTGMANLGEIQQAYKVAKEYGSGELVLLHCISGYPTPCEQANLATIKDLADNFDCVVGLSDHTLGTAVSVAAVAVGACVIEKHFTLKRRDGGADAAFSIEPDELETLCRDTQIAWSAIGTAGYGLKPAEEGNIQFRRSVYFVRDVKAGEVVTEQDVKKIRPGFGLPPKDLDKIIGRRVNGDVVKGTATNWDLLSAHRSIAEP